MALGCKRRLKKRRTFSAYLPICPGPFYKVTGSGLVPPTPGKRPIDCDSVLDRTYTMEKP
eukprot:2130075-Prymnesium_polylepis.1